MKTVGLIMASGAGTRFGSYVPKCFVSLNGKMVIQYVIDNMRKSGAFSEIYVCTLKEYEKYVIGLNNVTILYVEPMSRIENGMQAIRKLPEDTEAVVIQDSVRPFTTSDHFKRLVRDFSEPSDLDFLITYQKITDALFEKKTNTIKPHDRTEFALGQCPEIVKRKSILKCVFNPNLDYNKVSSFAEFMVHNGGRGSCFLFDGYNLKITYDYDLPLAENMLKYKRADYKGRPNLYGKKVLLFGGTGDIGKALKEYCQELGAVVDAPTRSECPADHIWAYKPHFRYDIVIHSIGTYTTDSEDIIPKYEEIMNTNVRSVIDCESQCHI